MKMQVILEKASTLIEITWGRGLFNHVFVVKLFVSFFSFTSVSLRKREIVALR